MCWFPILRNVIFNKLDLVNPEQETKQMLFRSISEDKWTIIENFVKRMFSNKIWIDKEPNIDVVLGNKKLELTDKLFKEKGFTTEWILGINTR